MNVALDESKAEIRIQFKDMSCALFGHSNRNELVLRVQPNTAIYMKMNMKSPGIETMPVTEELDMTYKHKYNFDLPEAYDRLILDIIRGDHSHFVRGDELEISWKIFTPLLHALEEKKVKPVPYVRGSRGPEEADVLRDRFGYKRTVDYEWTEPLLVSPISFVSCNKQSTERSKKGVAATARRSVAWCRPCVHSAPHAYELEDPLVEVPHVLVHRAPLLRGNAGRSSLVHDLQHHAVARVALLQQVAPGLLAGDRLVEAAAETPHVGAAALHAAP